MTIRQQGATLERIRTDAAFAELVATQLRGYAPSFARTVDELIANDEDDAVEFKSTARWDIRESARNPALEDAVVKTVAAFLNTDGGTLLIGVGVDLCRVDVSRSSQPVWASTSKGARVFFVRMNNSSRAMPDDEFAAYCADRWPAAG